MNMQNLKYFTIVATLENVSKAAELMHASQSTVSKSILSLEEELGVKLFDRMGIHEVPFGEHKSGHIASG